MTMTGARRRRFWVALVLVQALMNPAAAQSVTDPDCFPFAPGCERLPRLLDDLAGQIAPLLDEFAGRIDPYLTELQRLLGDMSGWEAPEVLPNGDILIRRRPSAPEPPREPDQPSGSEPVTEPLEL